MGEGLGPIGHTCGVDEETSMGEGLGPVGRTCMWCG